MHYSRLGHPCFALPHTSMCSYLLRSLRASFPPVTLALPCASSLESCSRRGSRFLFLTELSVIVPDETLDNLFQTLSTSHVHVFVPRPSLALDSYLAHPCGSPGVVPWRSSLKGLPSVIHPRAPPLPFTLWPGLRPFNIVPDNLVSPLWRLSRTSNF
jgi:hypothetical protein